jgi:hypothetical protein
MPNKPSATKSSVKSSVVDFTFEIRSLIRQETIVPVKSDETIISFRSIL